jgi:hypothetical protein
MNPPKKQVDSYGGDDESPTKFSRVSPMSRPAVTIKVEDAGTAESANLR